MSEAAPRLQRSPCVFVVDDEPANVAFLTRLIAAAGIEDVHGVTDPRDAVGTCLQLGAELQADLDMRAEHDRRLAAEQKERVQRVDAALSGDALKMVFQPIADLDTGNIIGLEALARFACEPLRPPNQWFAEAASVGRGTELELAAVRGAVSQLHRLPANAFLSVNISPATAVDPALERELAPVATDRVVLELTEHTRIDDYDILLAALGRFRDRGVRIAVDDTGAGYAGLRHVLQLRPDILKLDVWLTSGIDSDPARRALGAALVVFAREINAVIIAEGVETAAELETLRDLGIAWAQGYHLGRPAPLPQLRPGPVLGGNVRDGA